jgi:hypothetical protein
MMDLFFVLVTLAFFAAAGLGRGLTPRIHLVVPQLVPVSGKEARNA